MDPTRNMYDGCRFFCWLHNSKSSVKSIMTVIKKSLITVACLAALLIQLDIYLNTTLFFTEAKLRSLSSQRAYSSRDHIQVVDLYCVVVMSLLRLGSITFLQNPLKYRQYWWTWLFCMADFVVVNTVLHSMTLTLDEQGKGWTSMQWLLGSSLLAWMIALPVTVLRWLIAMRRYSQ